MFNTFAGAVTISALVLSTAACAGNLNDAYNSGGPGAGRTITADAGAVVIDGPDGLEVHGTTTTDILVITGGADVSEAFPISAPHPIPFGAAVVIDPDVPGQLRLSHREYDTHVVGVISGAGGIRPGVTLSNSEANATTQQVALVGRVYVLAEALTEPIQPGDLLTTSRVPGHAMKAVDLPRARGAILGKALSPLPEGRGLVLMLLALQ